jgi:hypothetical protein
VDPKPVPPIVTEEPIGPTVGDRLVTERDSSSVKATALLVKPPLTTVTEPLVAFDGTETLMLVSVQEFTEAEIPLNWTWLLWLAAPNPLPATVMVPPIGAAGGVRLVITGRTVKFMPLLDSPDTVTTTLPVVAPLGTGTLMLVALQLVGAAVVPLNVTPLAPCVAPKLVPVMVMAAPTPPEFGDRAEMLG